MEKLITRFTLLNREISYLEWFARFLLAFLSIATIKTLYIEGFKVAVELFSQLGMLVSVLLVSKVALRQITHTDMANAEVQIRNKVRITHYLLGAIDDLKNKISYVERALTIGSQPVSTLNQCIEDITRSYELLRDKDVYEYIGGETMGLIWELSATILGLQTMSKEITQALSKQNLSFIPNLAGRLPPETPIHEALDKLQKLDEQVRALRASLEAEDQNRRG